MKIHFMNKPKPLAESFACVPKQLRSIITLLVFTVVAHSAYAQTRTITGTVSDAILNEPIIGASVIIAKTNVGTVTNIDGKFTLNAPADAKQIIVSYIGYVSQTIDITNNNVLTIALKEDQTVLEEVVVVGYGTQKRANLTGSVSAIDSDKLMATKNGNVQNMLTGKLPGVRMIQKTSEPGEFNNQFDIRGFGSPTIVVDGVPRGNFERLDPNEIESISILKDASAAIYGVASANGVVLITTKKGQAGKREIEYSTYLGLQFPTEILKPVGAYDRMTLMNEKTKRDKPREPLMYGDKDFEDLANGLTRSYDWYDAVMKSNAPQQQHNLSIKGGSENTDYFVNIGYYNQKGFFKSNDLNYDRYNLRANINTKITKRLKASVRLNGILDNRERPNDDTWRVFAQLWRTNPITPIYANDNPKYPSYPSNQENAVVMTDGDVTGTRTNRKKIFQSSADLTYEIPYVKGLTAKALFSFDTTIDDNKTFQKKYYLYNYDEISEVYGVAGTKNEPNRVQRYYANSESRLWNLSLNYKNTLFEDHNIDALILYEEGYSTGDHFSARRNLRLPLPYLSVGEATGQLAEGSAPNEYAKKSVVGRLSYDYKGKYLLEASFRYDGSSKYLPDKQWNLFPSVSLGWRMSEEAFIKDNLPFINNLKLRGSYGKLGTDATNLYTFLDGYDYPSTGGNRETGYPNVYYFGDDLLPTVGVRATANPNITWETIKIANLGIDGDLWNGLLGFSVDVFRRDRDDLYAERIATLPTIFGSGMPKENLDSDRTEGFELELRHYNRIGKVSYNLAGNMALTRTKRMNVTRTPEGNSYNNWRNNTNNRYNDIWWGKGTIGQQQSYEQIATHPVLNNGSMPGDYIYEDWNGDGTIDDNDIHPIATTISTGNNFQDKRNYPLMNFGFSGGASYNGFDLDFLFQGSAMSYVSYGEQLGSSLAWDGNALDYFMDRWRPVDPTADPYDPNIQWIKGHYAYGSRMADINSRFMIQNGAYLRLKSLTVGYTVPNKLIAPIGITNLRIYVSTYNLFTITGVKALDPERPAELYGYMYPLNKTINFGASIRF